MPTALIADCCNNHMGDRRVMETMIKAAAGAGVDIVKFQSFQADKLRKDWPDYDNAHAYYKAHELSESDHVWLMEKCREYGVSFLTTAFDLDTVDMLADLGLKQVKIASPDANNWALIDKCLEKFDKVFISTGMHMREEIVQLVGRIRSRKAMDRVNLFYCVSTYPVRPEDIHLREMRVFYSGFSDHTDNLDAAKLAIALGADYVERHFTLSRHLPGKDQAISSTPEEFAELAAWKRKVEIMMGSGVRELTGQELENRKKYVGRWSG